MVPEFFTAFVNQDERSLTLSNYIDEVMQVELSIVASEHNWLNQVTTLRN